MSELDILPIKPLDIKETKSYHPHLPSIDRNRGSLILIVGSQNSGKTTIINNLLLSKHFWGGKESAFDGGVFIFSPSLDLDDSCRFLREQFECYTEYKNEYLEEIIKRQKEYPKDKMPKIMIVIDDSSGLIDRNSNINHFLTRFRHSNANIILSIQNFKSLSPIARSNASAVLLMNGIINDKEMFKIEEEYDGQYKGTLKYMYEEYANTPYSFLYMKVRKNPPEAYRNFTEPIEWKKLVKVAKMKKSKKVLDKEIEEDE